MTERSKRQQWKWTPADGLFCGITLILVRAASRWGKSTGLWVDSLSWQRLSPLVSTSTHTHTHNSLIKSILVLLANPFFNSCSLNFFQIESSCSSSSSCHAASLVWEKGLVHSWAYFYQLLHLFSCLHPSPPISINILPTHLLVHTPNP